MINQNKNKLLFITIDPIEYRRRVLNQMTVAREYGFEVSVISIGERGKRYKNAEDFFHEKRIFVRFQGGPLKFIEFNLKLFWSILWNRYDIIHLRGLWVLPAVMMRQIIRHSHLIYDAHEYFAGLEIFHNRPLRKQLWLLVEKLSIPHINTLITVSEPLGDLYRNRYPKLKRILILKNMPSSRDIQPFDRSKFDSSKKRYKLIFHGYFLKGRALIQTIMAITLLQDILLEVILIGQGPLKGKLEHLVEQYRLQNMVRFHPFLKPDQLLPVIAQADIGLSLVEDNCLSQRYALPNKFFDLVSAGVPVLASNIHTLKFYMDKYDLGLTVDPQNINEISEAIRTMLLDVNKRRKWALNCLSAAKNDLNWEQEAEKLKHCYAALLADN